MILNSKYVIEEDTIYTHIIVKFKKRNVNTLWFIGKNVILQKWALMEKYCQIDHIILDFRWGNLDTSL